MRTILELSWFHELDYVQKEAWMHYIEKVVPEPLQAWPFYPFADENEAQYHPRLYLETLGGVDIRSDEAERARWINHDTGCTVEEWSSG
jgi:hypothetical protein